MTLSVEDTRPRQSPARRTTKGSKRGGKASPIWRPLVNLHIFSGLIAKIDSMSRGRRLRAGLFAGLSLVFIWLVISSLNGYRREQSLPFNPDLRSGSELDSTPSLEGLAPPERAASDVTPKTSAWDEDTTIPTAEQLASQAEGILARTH